MRWISVLLVAILALCFAYLGRFWIFDLWGRPGRFGWSTLRPQGDLIATWLRGTPLRPFDLMIWAIGVFLALTLLQNIINRLTRPPE